MVQMVIGRPPERFPSPESRPDSPRPAQWLSQVGPFGLFGHLSRVPGGSGVVQWVTKPPQKRFRTSKSPPDTPRPAQSQPKNGLFSPLWLLWRHIVVKPVIAVKIRRIKIFPVNQYEMTLAHRFVFLGKAGARRRPLKKTKKNCASVIPYRRSRASILLR